MNILQDILSRLTFGEKVCIVLVVLGLLVLFGEVLAPRALENIEKYKDIDPRLLN